MKKFLPLFATLLLLNGCTLTMEDYSTPEEELGKEEPYTIESEYGSLTYQFADSVIYVTERVQDHLQVVSKDSILYFDPNMPAEWRPFRGAKLAAGISHKLPYGLNSRVISVENENGLLKVVTTRIPVKEVYKHLSYNLDSEVAAPDVTGMTEEELEDYGYQMVINEETGDTIIHDWNDYDIDKGLRPAGAKRKSLKQYLARTRTDEEKDKLSGHDDNKDDGKEKTETTESTTYIDVNIDTRDFQNAKLGKGAAADAFKGIAEKLVANAARANASNQNAKKYYAALGLTYTGYTRCHLEHDEDANYEYKYTDSWTELTIKLEAGLDYKKEKSHDGNNLGVADDDFMMSMADVMRDKESFKQMFQKHKNTWDHLRVRIVLTMSPVPIAFVAGATITPTFEINGNVCVSGTYTSDVKRSGYKDLNGTKEDIDKVLTEKESKIKSGWKFDGVVLNGSIKVGVSGRIFVGAEIGGTIGLTFGFNCDAFLEGTASMDILNLDGHTDEDGETHHFFTNFKGDIRFYCDVYGDMTVYVAPLGFQLWEKQLAKFLLKRLIEETIILGPRIGFVSGWAESGASVPKDEFDFSDEIDDDAAVVRAYYKVSSTVGMLAWTALHSYYPAMKLYFGPISNNVYEYMYPMVKNDNGKYDLVSSMSKWDMVSSDKIYDFYWTGNLKDKVKNEDEQITEMHAVPVLYYYGGGYNPLYGGSVNFYQARKYMNFAVELKEHQHVLEVAKPDIVTLAAGQIYGRPTLDFQDEKTGIYYNGYVSTKKGDEVGGHSTTKKVDLRAYGIYTNVEVKSGSRLKEWGFMVYIYDQSKEKRLLRRRVPVNLNRSGQYTFIFNFETDWTAPEGVSVAPLYFRVLPYRIEKADKEGKEIDSTDKNSLKKWTIKYEMDGSVDNIKSGDLWGEVMPEIDLHAN